MLTVVVKGDAVTARREAANRGIPIAAPPLKTNFGETIIRVPDEYETAVREWFAQDQDAVYDGSFALAMPVGACLFWARYN